MNKYIMYIRVSTKRQGDSRLGLMAQKSAIESYIKSVNGVKIAEFEEVETARNKDVISIHNNINLDTLLRRRPLLKQAILLAKAENATIVVKEPSRLSRFSFLIDYLIATNIKFVCTDSPNDEPMITKIKVAVHEEEVRRLSQRVSEAYQKMVETGRVRKRKKKGSEYMRELSKLSHDARQQLAANNDDYIRVYIIAKKMFMENKPVKEIVKVVNMLNYRTFNNKHFNIAAIRRIVNNKYIEERLKML